MTIVVLVVAVALCAAYLLWEAWSADLAQDR
jgi:hypothetical protein